MQEICFTYTKKALHAGEKPYMLERSLTCRRAALHTGEKLYTALHREEALNRREALHTGENPYTQEISNTHRRDLT